MKIQVNLDEAKERLSDLVEAAIRGDEVFILQDNHPVVQLVPVELPERRARFGSAKGKVFMADDFDAPLQDFGVGDD